LAWAPWLVADVLNETEILIEQPPQEFKQTIKVMRTRTNTINPASLFWYAVYATAVLLFFVGGIVVGKHSSRIPAKN
jgi:hypothetical protein